MSRASRAVSWGVCAAFMALLSGCGSEAIPIDDPVPTYPYDPVRTPTPTKPTPPTLPQPGDPPQPTEPIVPPTKPGCESPSTFFADADGDGFGDDASAIAACEAPVGYVANGGDCMDSNADVHPGQSAFFTTDRGDGSFDYDCDGVEARELEKIDPEFCLCSLPPYGAGCSQTEGWLKEVPSCGAAAAYDNAKPGPIVQTCDPDVSILVQGCR